MMVGAVLYNRLIPTSEMAAGPENTSLTKSNTRWFSYHFGMSFFFFSSVLIMQTSKGEAALAPEEESVLEVLREIFNQPDWVGDPCNSETNDPNWITCSNSSGVFYVQTIDLRGQNLNGTIPADIAKLQRIHDIRLSYNKLEGPIPDLGNMTSVINLDLTNNRLSGRILNTSSFTNISQLLLGGNNLSGEIPESLFQHSSATSIDLNSNSIGGPIPDMSELINLNILDLHDNQINGSIPESINKLARANQINFRNNSNLKGTVPDLSGLTNMGYFDVQLCGLTGTLPPLENSVNLQGIYLAHNDFTGNIPPALFRHSALQWLLLNDNPRLSGVIPDTNLLTSVEIFNLFDCNFSGPLPSSLEGNKVLRQLNVDNNHLTSIPSDFRNLSKLQKIDVSNNRMIGNLPELPAASTQTSHEGYVLTHLNFSGNNFSGEIPKSWSELTFLKILKLDRNTLSGRIPTEFGNLRNLEELDLRNNQFNGTVPDTLLNLPNLKTLRLDNNMFTEISDALIHKEGLNITYENNMNLNIITRNSSNSDLSSGTIVGVVIGVVVAIIVLLGLLVYLTRRYRSKYEDPLSREDMPKSARSFTLKQIKTITANNKTLIGKGGFGQVYHGQLPDGMEVAVKVRTVDSRKGAEEFLNEVRLLSRLHHGNLVPLVGYCLEAEQQILVYQYMPQGTLYSHLYQTGLYGSNTTSSEPSTYQPLDWSTRLDIAINAARGLDYLHKDCNPPVIHGDVKSSNILLTDKLQAKVADLGISKQALQRDSGAAFNLSGVSTAIKGAFGYLDPEYFVGRKLTTKSDVYSFGMVLLETITGRRPHSHSFPNTDETNLVDWARDAVRNDHVQAIVDPALRGRYMPDGLLKVAKTAVSCVSPSGAERPDMGEIVNILIEALEMEGPYLETFTPANEINVPFTDQLGDHLETHNSSTASSTQTSREAFFHPPWNVDPR